MVFLKFQEKAYQSVRSIISSVNHWTGQDYEPVVNSGQWLLTKLKIPSLYSNYSHNLDSLNINSELFSLSFDSPITFAAFESHLDSILFWLNLGCGGGCLKTIKLEKEAGNQRPRIQRLKINGKDHLINALGLPGGGIHKLIESLHQSDLVKTKRPIGFSVGGHSLQDYKDVIDVIVDQQNQLFKQSYIELNISCPNTTTGKSLHDNLAELEQCLNYIQAKQDGVIVIKVSPDASDKNICDIAALAKSFSQVTINAGNTQFKSEQEVGLTSGAMSIGGGGLSGPVLFERTLAMAKLLSQFNLPIIATGGISSADQVIALKEHGVALVGIATGLVTNPFIIPRLNYALKD